MAGAKPGVHVVQLKPIQVPPSLVTGAKFVKWDDDSGQAIPVTLRVDKNGFFLYWTDQNKETEILEISNIRDTRTGKYARTPKDPKLQYYTNIGTQDAIEDKTVTIIYGPDFVNNNFINFSCDRKELAKEWTDELLKMAFNLLALNASATTFLEKAHTKVCLQLDKEGKIPVKNVVKLFAQNREDKKKVEKALESVGLSFGKNEVVCPTAFTFEVFLNFYKHLTGRKEAENIFTELCSSGKHGNKSSTKSHMSVEQLVYFFNHQQRDPRLNEILYPYVTPARAQDVINQYEPNPSIAQKAQMSFDGFLRYLMSDDNAIVSPEKFDLNEDMDQPLPHYFINSSHNTYLTGHQLTGRSSVEIYRQCLLSGCRCVELDCWNGRTSEDEPIITHGFTVVTEVMFKDVIEAIAESAFKTSDYPIILSFENHCSPKVQAKMAMYCRKIFGDMLLPDPMPSHPLIPGQSLPSPNQLLRKIIIKNKKKHYHHRGSNNGSTGNGELKGAGAPGGGGLAYVSPGEGGGQVARLQKTNSSDSQGEGTVAVSSLNGTNGMVVAIVDSPPTLEDSESESESDVEEDFPPEILHQIERKESTDKETGTAYKESEAGAEMSALVNYIQPVHFHSFEVSEKRNRSYEISSFVETNATNLLKEHPVDFVNYNKRQLSRIYPKGTRVDSSNYMPQVFWNAGCQLVALNFQSLDLAMQLNLGIYEYNGRSGYLLKPDFMRRHDRKFDPFAESTVDGIIAGSMSVKIISGQFLTDKRVSTYVEVESYGLPADTVRKKFRTKTVANNGINPVYDDEPFVFKKVVLPELCVIRFIVCEEGGKMIGHRVLPVVGLRPGYRHISLRNECGQPLALPTLFVHITVKDYVPDKLSDIADALVNPIKYQSELEKRAEQLSALMEDFDVDSDGSTKVNKTPVKSPNMSDGTVSRPIKQSSYGDSGGSTIGTAHSRDDVVTVPSSSILSTSPSGASDSQMMDKDLPKRKDSRKGNVATKSVSSDYPPEGETLSFEIPENLLIAESLEKLKENKTVQSLITKLNKELQMLKRQQNKHTSKTEEVFHKEEEKMGKQKVKSSKSLVKMRKASVSNDMNSSTKSKDAVVVDPATENKLVELHRSRSQKLLILHRDHCKTEMELKLKYNKRISMTLEKCLQDSQAAQLKSLDDFFESNKNDIKRRTNVQQHEEIRELKKLFSEKNERERMKREIQQRHISQAVTELQKLEESSSVKRQELLHQFDVVKRTFEEDRDSENEKLQSFFDEQLMKIEENLNSIEVAEKTPSPLKEVSAL